MNRNKSSNPMFSDRVMNNVTLDQAQAGTETMTINGTLQKSFIMLIILIASAFVSWRVGLEEELMHLRMPVMIGGAIVGLVLVLIASFKPTTSPIVGPFYAMAEGLFLGVVSAMYAAAYSGIVMQAIMLTMFVLFGMLGLYYFRVIKVTDRLRSIVMSATLGVLLTYVATWILSFFGISVPFIHGSNWMGIGFSLFVVGLAAFNLLLDFDFIEKGSKHGMPKYGEWFAAIGLMVTLVWLYLEILRLLSKLQRD